MSHTKDIWTVRDVSMADADWVIDLAQEAYGQPLDRRGCKDWIADALTNGQNVFFRMSPHCVGVGVTQRAFHDPHLTQAHMLYLFARKNRRMEGYKMLILMTMWAKQTGANSFHFGSSTSRDLSPLAHRLRKHGFVPDQPSWTIKLKS